MRRAFLLTIGVLVFAGVIFSQDRPPSIKLFEFDKKTETTDAFAGKAKVLFDRLKTDKESSGFISISKNDDLYKVLSKMLKLNDDLKNRVYFIDRPVFYISSSEMVEFWLIPLGSEPPFTTGCGGCNCPSIEVADDELIDPLTVATTFGFTAKLSGADYDLTPLFKWKIAGADIVKGAGTAEIKVKPHFPFEKEITATVEIGGLDPSCNCPNTASQTIRLNP